MSITATDLAVGLPSGSLLILDPPPPSLPPLEYFRWQLTRSPRLSARRVGSLQVVELDLTVLSNHSRVPILGGAVQGRALEVDVTVFALRRERARRTRPAHTGFSCRGSRTGPSPGCTAAPRLPPAARTRSARAAAPPCPPSTRFSGARRFVPRHGAVVRHPGHLRGPYAVFTSELLGLFNLATRFLTEIHSSTIRLRPRSRPPRQRFATMPTSAGRMTRSCSEYP